MKPYYENSGIMIYHGQCEDALPRIVECDHIITDPPYSEHTHSKQWIGAALTANGNPRVSTAHKELGFDYLSDEVRAFISKESTRLAKRWCLYFSDVESFYLWKRDLQTSGLDYVRTCFWDKVDSAPQFTGDRPAASVEAIVCAHKPGRKKWNGGGRRNLFTHAVNGLNRGSKPHPSTKPVQLMSELLSLFTDENDLIVDPFMGSGSTLRAAKDLHRRAIGIEMEEKYCEIAALRMGQEVFAF